MTTGFRVMEIIGTRSHAVSRVFLVRDSAEQFQNLFLRAKPGARTFITQVSPAPAAGSNSCARAGSAHLTEN
jgi:hypothetical protein